MLSEREREYLLDNISVSNRYARMLRWRIRKKAQRMKVDLEIVQNSHVDLSRKPPPTRKEPPERFPVVWVKRVKRRPKERSEVYQWPPIY